MDARPLRRHFMPSIRTQPLAVACLSGDLSVKDANRERLQSTLGSWSDRPLFVNRILINRGLIVFVVIRSASFQNRDFGPALGRQAAQRWDTP